MNSNSCKNKKYHIRGICPVCGKTNLTYGKIILTKDNKIYQIVECENCDSSFKECFQNKKFIGYDNINLEID